MKNKCHYLFILASTSLLLSLSSFTFSDCIKAGSFTKIENNTSTPLNFGQIYYSSHYIQPIGSIIGQIIVPPSHQALNPETALWICDKRDLPNIYFLAATVGWDSFGGYEHLGNDVYATWFRYIGLKQTMAGVTLGKNWKRVNIKTYKIENNKIYIRLRDIPPLEATLIKVSNLPKFNPARTACNRSMAIAGSYADASIFRGRTGSCNTPSAFVQLSGNSKANLRFGHDDIGTDSGSRYRFYAANNGISYGLNKSNTTLSQQDICAIKIQQPLIKIPAISFSELNNNASAPVNFSIELECNENLKPGINTSQIAIGFLPSQNSYAHSKSLNLLSANGASRFLVSDNYNHANTAKGVGLTIQNPRTRRNIHYLRPNAPIGGGNAAGWYSIIESNTNSLNSRASGYMLYSKEYSAILQKLPNQTPTPGQFKATATIMVKVQ